jgi:hypothetical protein
MSDEPIYVYAENVGRAGDVVVWDHYAECVEDVVERHGDDIVRYAENETEAVETARAEFRNMVPSRTGYPLKCARQVLEHFWEAPVTEASFTYEYLGDQATPEDLVPFKAKVTEVMDEDFDVREYHWDDRENGLHLEVTCITQTADDIIEAVFEGKHGQWLGASPCES